VLNKKTLIIITLFSLFLLLVTLLVLHQKKTSDLKSVFIQRDRIFGDYMLNSNSLLTRDEENMALLEMSDFLNDSVLVVFVPEGLCRSCLSSLFICLREKEWPMNNVRVLSASDDYSFKREIITTGCQYILSNTDYDKLTSIIVLRKAKGYNPIYIKYSDEYDFILNLFLSQ
jgi:hypothetical protein